ncbi:MAG: uracil-DNA glycosylase [Pseudomonadota bacterium]
MTDLSSPDAPREALLAALAWQVEMGVDEVVCEAPQDRFAEHAAALAEQEAKRAAQAEAQAPGPAAAQPAARSAAQPGAAPARAAAPDEPRTEAARLSAAAMDLPALEAAVRAFDRCPLKQGARNTVFADGTPGAPLMIVGEAPGRDEDREGKPFVGRAGQMLDAMLAGIGRTRAAEDPGRAVYITNLVYWRPVQNRTPSDDETAMLLPFLERHIELARPRAVLLAGGVGAKALLRTSTGILRLRGKWRRWNGVPVLPTLHPAYLLRQGEKKREAWRDLLSLAAFLDGEDVTFEDAPA